VVLYVKLEKRLVGGLALARLELGISGPELCTPTPDRLTEIVSPRLLMFRLGTHASSSRTNTANGGFSWFSPQNRTEGAEPAVMD